MNFTKSGCVFVYRYTKEGNCNECVISPCMVMKTIGIPSCTKSAHIQPQPRSHVCAFVFPICKKSSKATQKVASICNFKLLLFLSSNHRSELVLSSFLVVHKLSGIETKLQFWVEFVAVRSALEFFLCT